MAHSFPQPAFDFALDRFSHAGVLLFLSQHLAPLSLRLCSVWRACSPAELSALPSQPDIYPGNCWAFRGSQGYLVVRLSMQIRPTTFTLEHIPKTLSPTGNITSAPKDFAVYVSVSGPGRRSPPLPLGVSQR